MKFALPGLAAIMMAGLIAAAAAQSTSGTPMSAVPPSGPSRQSSVPPSTQPKSGTPSSTVKPGQAYNSGSANVGNSSENNGVPGSQGAGASATMQSGHATNR
jgi:hypothetical protein